MLRSTYSNAARILVTSPHLYDLFPSSYHHKMQIFVEHGVEASLPRGLREQSAAKRLRLLYVGRIVRTKGLRDGIRALAHVPGDIEVTLDVVGEGPDMPYCAGEVSRLALTNKVRFHGKLPRSEVDDFYSRADALLFPSFREATGGVIFEAMAAGLPQICAHFGGPAAIVTEKTGLLVNPTSPAQYPLDLASAIAKLANDRSLMARLSQGSIRRIDDEYIWPRRGEILKGILEDVFVASA
jgi:glycosyltransferase involved in cell wall biosynthesis